MDFIKDKIEVLTDKLKQLSRQSVGSVGVIEYVPCEYKQGNTPPETGWTPFEKGMRVFGKDRHYWFRASFSTPSAQPGKRLCLQIYTGYDDCWDAMNPQGIVYLNGKMIQGVDSNHTDVELEPDTNYLMYVYFYVGMLEGGHGLQTSSEFLAELVTVDEQIERTFYDLRVPLDACRLLNENSEDYVESMRILEQAANLLVMWPEYGERFYCSLEECSDFLKREFYEGICGHSRAVVECIGHTHIDVGFYWTVAQTREKVQRSFSTVLELMRRYPEYKFTSSQPQLYRFLKEEAPQVYEEIKQRVKEGRWEVEGGMWLEADCNLISGESMVRQFLYGKRFMKEEFGVDSKILWLPDVFGYSAAMPQVLKGCGIDYFVTTKISWSEFNKMPYDTFMWEGIDGTEIFTNFITVQDLPENGEPDNFCNYVGEITPSMTLGTWKRYQHKEYNNQVVLTYGYGDGGGGPTRWMLENQRRLEYGLPGFPKTHMNTAKAWLKAAEKNFNKNTYALRRTPKWSGELYLELHRGTYTSNAKNKRNNRKSEFLMQMAEGLSAIHSRMLGGKYPYQKLDAQWEIILRNQFHDILPGSAIYEVYEVCDREYAKIKEEGEAIVREKLEALSENITSDGGVFVYNPLGFSRSGIIMAEGKTYETEKIPAFGWKVIKPYKKEKRVHVSGNTIENDHYILKLDKEGRIESLLDKRFNRQVFKTGQYGNEIQVFEDYPKKYDAWEISNYYKQKMWLMDGEITMKPVEDGDRAGIHMKRQYQHSCWNQTIWLYNASPRIDFETHVDWHEEHQLVKANFPFDIHANEATYEIQYGNLKRATHENTSWDEAKFEVCAQKWADISEDGYGVSLLNDCKYGHSAEGSSLSLTLLKCATDPNIHADQGEHRFTYSLLPHGGGWRDGDTVRQAYDLNQPLLSCAVSQNKGCLPESFSMVSCDCPNVIIDTVKQAEDGNGLIIRLYEAYDRRSEAVISFGMDVKKVSRCDLLENKIQDLKAEGNQVQIPVKNYEIVTLKVE